ncbi:S41 family peptidase [Patescibacteria group bacterium]
MRFKLKNIPIAILCTLFFVQSASAQFVDVVEQSLFYDAITYFIEEVPILATDRDRFKPLDKVTKAEFFKLLYESAGYTTSDETFDIPFHDVVGDEWFATYVNRALENNLIEFDEFDPNFNPAETVSRCEAVNFVIKLYDIDSNIVDDIPNEYTDVSSLDLCSNTSKIAFILELLHDYKTRQFNTEKELTRAEAIHIFYKVQKNDLSINLASQSSTSSPSYSYNDKNFDLFFQIWNKVNDDYVEKDEINQSELMYGAITGMVDKLNDPYSVFFEPLDANDYKNTLEGAFEGIGIYINQIDGQFIILTPLKGSPAEEADIKPNDIIIEVDDEIVQGLDMDQLIDLLRGPAGSEVKLKIKRGSNYYFKNIVRTHIDVPYVESEIIDDIGIIYYYQFTSNSNDQFKTEIEKIIAQNPKGIIIDLRNNPGGYVYSSQLLISRFIPKGETYVNFIMADGTSYGENSLGPGDLKDYPIAVLINEGSASASEIAALALKDAAGATIIGAPSFGKEKIQEIITYNDGSSLKLSIAKWTSPNGTSVSENGIEPDYNIKLGDTEDSQLNKALQLIN